MANEQERKLDPEKFFFKGMTEDLIDWEKKHLRTSATLEGDVQIGAVELKNKDTDDRAVINADGTVDVNVGRFDTATTPAGGVDVGTTSTQVLAAKSNRKFAAIVNDSDTVIYLALGGTAVLNSGIRLNANGGSFEINATNLYRGVVSAIHGGVGNKRLTIVEA